MEAIPYFQVLITQIRFVYGNLRRNNLELKIPDAFVSTIRFFSLLMILIQILAFLKMEFLVWHPKKTLDKFFKI